MLLRNKSSRNVSVFAGIMVPANSELPVASEMVDAVTNSPLIASYIKSGTLEIFTPKAAVKETVVAKVAKPSKPSED